MITPKVQFHCPACDSTSVHREATAYWDVASQAWNLSDDLSDYAACGDCGWSTSRDGDELVSWPVPPFDALVTEYNGWLAAQPLHIGGAEDTSAEALLHEEITPEQRRWLSDFVQRWDAMEQEQQA
jgi:predicted RNA-binding Zn-ribbon protein involved in translation (DUF1610 family)